MAAALMSFPPVERAVMTSGTPSAVPDKSGQALPE